ncbi:COG1361 family protein [Thermococcus barophilus]|uniref:Uncharacterized protein n=1 Tax=Thermococcus barophilus (strain DSM 11836 / MP) TaxID=391623 RepID=F0LJR7_THEBM|nr:hypothetical protein [Thermococcus barophilus]ADT84709.1 hypothetical protein TERMP_01734 [Thermococcus barophilus MP]
MKKVIVILMLLLCFSLPVSAQNESKIFVWLRIGESVTIGTYTIKVVDVDKDFAKALIQVYRYGLLYRMGTISVNEGLMVDNIQIYLEDSFKSEIYPAVLLEIDVPYFKVGESIVLKNKQIEVIKANESYAELDLGYANVTLSKERTYYKDKNFEIKLNPLDYLFREYIYKDQSGDIIYKGISDGKALLVIKNKTYELSKGEKIYVDDVTLLTLLEFDENRALVRLDLVNATYLTVKEMPYFEGFIAEHEKVRLSKLYELEVSNFIDENHVEVALYRAGNMVEKKVLSTDNPYLVYYPLAIKFKYGFAGIRNNLAYFVIFADEKALKREEEGIRIPILDIKVKLPEKVHLGENIPLNLTIRNIGDAPAENLEVIIFTDGMKSRTLTPSFLPNATIIDNSTITIEKENQSLIIEILYDYNGKAYRRIIKHKFEVLDPEITFSAKLNLPDNATLGVPFNATVTYTIYTNYPSSFVLTIEGNGITYLSSPIMTAESPSEGTFTVEIAPVKTGNLTLKLESLFPKKQILDTATIPVYQFKKVQIVEKVVEKYINCENTTQNITTPNQPAIQCPNETKIVYTPVEKVVEKEVLPIGKTSLIAIISLLLGIVLGSLLLGEKLKNILERA